MVFAVHAQSLRVCSRLQRLRPAPLHHVWRWQLAQALRYAHACCGRWLAYPACCLTLRPLLPPALLLLLTGLVRELVVIAVLAVLGQVMEMPVEMRVPMVLASFANGRREVTTLLMSR